MDPAEIAREAERRLHTIDVRQDRDALERLLAPDYVQFGTSGLAWTRDEVLDLAGHYVSSVYPFTIAGMQSRMLAPDLVLVTFLSELGDKRARRSSIWRVVDDEARLVFHQGTPIS
jgi:hypothetical protein